ncbi:Arf/Sar family, other [Strigomonas culicis]|uniref:Arf/Sar family, other n=1 Tax=Strigomonas culicis TaxID=28005 RepID=S9UWW2_9TRYP|nr:Arf/Sar family, other [Strigomonas culicis]|eukprot:EPY33363.1 Arf/Sar family, other [Strigomonas culicis]
MSVTGAVLLSPSPSFFPFTFFFPRFAFSHRSVERLTYTSFRVVKLIHNNIYCTYRSLLTPRQASFSAMSEDEQRVAYCKEHNIHHLFELLATKVLVERPKNPFEYLRGLLQSVEESEQKKNTYDPTQIQFQSTKTADKKELKKLTIGTFGLDNAGKSTLLTALAGEIEPQCTPTVGFSPTQFQTDEYDICIFDLGGAANFRGIWVHYFHDCHGIIYVVDSASEEKTVAESLKVLTDTLQHPYVGGKPLLVLANKKDLPGARKEAVVPDGFLEQLLLPGTPHRVVATCGVKEDLALEGGVEWLLATVGERFEQLSKRVADDCKRVKEEKDRQRAERLAALRAEAP